MKTTKIFLLLIAMLVAVTLTACGGGGGGGDSGGPSGGGGVSGSTSVKLPKTGQTTSYLTYDDGMLQMGVAWPSQRFTIDGTGLCITDNLTGLMWVKTPDSTTRTWQQALDYANNLTICGFSDWRLPNRKELRSLISYGQADNPTWLNGQGFSNVLNFSYWSSSTYATVTANAWFVYMLDGSALSNLKTISLNVWPVRAGGAAPANLPKTGQTTCYNASGTVIACANTGQDGELQTGVAWPSQRFTIDGTGLCITDNLTGLMWVKTPDSTTRTWTNALTYVYGLSLCGYDDWRLPNVNELESLINAEQANSAAWLSLPAQGFSNVAAGFYWSSSTYAGSTINGWYVNMYGGSVESGSKNATVYVWPVRGGQ